MNMRKRYSMNGRFDETTMPPSVKAWLESYARQIEIIAAGKGRLARVPIHSESIFYNDTYYIQPNSSKAIPFDLGTTLAKGIYKADILYASTFDGMTLDKSMELFFEIDDTGHTTTGINTIDNLIQFDGDAIYDLSGRKIVDNYAFLRRSALQASKARVRIMHSLQAKRAELGSALPKGIYIQNGKKIIVK